MEKKIINMTSGTIIVKCKDFQIMTLEITGVEECNNIAYSLECLSNIGEMQT